MNWTRRRFVTSVAAGAAGLSVGARLRAADAVQERFGVRLELEIELIGGPDSHGGAASDLRT